MGYELYVDHPESAERKAKDFDSWSFWAPQNAPWTGVGISSQAKLLQAVCAAPDQANACQVLDTGGTMTAQEARSVLGLSEVEMTEKVREVFLKAVQTGYGVRVVFSKGFGAISASAYLAKHGSA